MCPSPDAAARVTGAEVLVDELAVDGCEFVFGLPGTTVMDVIDAIGRRDALRFISVRHEQVAAFMADGYARASGRPGVCLASRGPGAANLAIGLHNSFAESVPVLAIIGQVSDRIAYREAFEEMDLLTFFRPVTKDAIEVHVAERVGELTRRALQLAGSGRKRPVAISVPLDHLQAHVTPRDAPTVAPARSRPRIPRAASRDVTLAVEMLANATRPIVIVGGGTLGNDHPKGVIKLAEELQIGVVTTWLRKNAFPNDHSLYVGPLGFGAPDVTERAVAEADVVLALGCRFSEFTTRQWTLLAADAELIHVEADPDELGRCYQPTLGIVADARVTADEMASLASGSSVPRNQIEARRGRARRLRAEYVESTIIIEEPRVGEAAGVSSAAVVNALDEVLRNETATILVQDVPTFGPWIAQHLPIIEPASNYASSGGAMGWGFAAAMGIQLARPTDRVICLTGDGSFWMVAQDLETAVRERIPLVTIVINNFAYGNTRDRQRLDHGGRYLGVFYDNPDFAAFARLLGAHGERVEQADDLAPAIQRSLDAGCPAVIDVIQDQHAGLPGTVRPPETGNAASEHGRQEGER